MHFSKTYLQLLLTLPEDLRTSAIEYRQLKKLVNEVVTELESLGFSPLVLHDLLQSGKPLNLCSQIVVGRQGGSEGDKRAHAEAASELDGLHEPHSVSPTPYSSPPTMVYELVDASESGEIAPRLRLWIGSDALSSHSTAEAIGCIQSPRIAPSAPTLGIHEDPPARGTTCPFGNTAIPSSPGPQLGKTTAWRLHNRSARSNNLPEPPACKNNSATLLKQNDDSIIPTYDGEQMVIPLVSDTAFFRTLTTALRSLSAVLDLSRESFTSSVHSLSRAISRTSRPASAKNESDLYTWRAIFQLYMEAQVFESTFERDRGQRSVEASEERLALFARRVNERRFSLTIPDSRRALRHFLKLNVQIMNLKKFQHANAEAARKILKKHAKRTSLPLPPTATENIPPLEPSQSTAQIPHMLVVALTETLMPVVPYIDDYLCLICFALAFKPIRLRCGHLFCVRCLVKMQKRGNDNCPLCRAPTVLIANKFNVDHALTNFMWDWFPREVKEKARANERESAKEEMEELGFDTRCGIM